MRRAVSSDKPPIQLHKSRFWPGATRQRKLRPAAFPQVRGFAPILSSRSSIFSFTIHEPVSEAVHSDSPQLREDCRRNRPASPHDHGSSPWDRERPELGERGGCATYPPLAAISPYLRHGKIYEFEKFWDEWIEQQEARAKAGQLSRDWVRCIPSAELGPLGALV